VISAKSFSMSVAMVIASFLARCLEAVRNDLVISLQPSSGCKSLGQTFLK
jgi:hypothetical protein